MVWGRARDSISRLHSCSYLQYSGICARLLRQALKPEYRASALKREESLMKVQKWKDGQPGAPGLQDCSNKSPLNYCASVYYTNGCPRLIVPFCYILILNLWSCWQRVTHWQSAYLRSRTLPGYNFSCVDYGTSNRLYKVISTALDLCRSAWEQG